MPNKFFTIWGLMLFTACSSASSEKEHPEGELPLVVPSFKEIRIADFETEQTTPYFFRFGNKGTAKEYDYKPRWVYSHAVTENPAKESPNISSRVLKYTSMEARDYGIKFLFAAPVSIDEISNIQLSVYQPENVLGKPLWNGETPARTQQLCIRLLSDFNTINDFRQEEGITLSSQVQSFTEENKWITYSFQFNKADYKGQLNKFKNGIVGIAFLPTYQSGVTLQEDKPYICYVDNIVLNPAE